MLCFFFFNRVSSVIRTQRRYFSMIKKTYVMIANNILCCSLQRIFVQEIGESQESKGIS